VAIAVMGDPPGLDVADRVGPLTEVDVAFVIADLAGFTALTETHGNRFAAGLITRYVEIARAALAEGARLAERVGDAVLVVATHPGPAVRTALALRESVEREPLFPSLRVGVHAGRVVALAGAYFGTPLNLTARLAAHAEPGQILCTEEIARGAIDVEGTEFRSLGAVVLKNIARPVHVLEIGPRAPAAADAALDPVCRMRIDPRSAPAAVVHDGVPHYFCSPACAQLFVARLAPDATGGP
jgi:class 3 adenylate cyclase/YHS domain-containing protein